MKTHHEEDSISWPESQADGSPVDAERRPSQTTRLTVNWAEKAGSTFDEFYQNFDFTNTRFGPRESWNATLRQTVRYMMADTSPGIVHWGESSSVIYNEAYSKLIGEKHPNMMGSGSRDAFPDFWDDFAEIIAEQRRRKITVSGEATMLLMQRRGFLEETYFDWKLIPILGEDGEMQGAYGTAADLTSEVIRRRQRACIYQIIQRVSGAESKRALWEAALDGLASDEKDIPLALLYTVEEPDKPAAGLSSQSIKCCLEGSFGINAGHKAAAECIDLHADVDGFAPTMLKALRNGSTAILEANDSALSKLLEGIDWRGYQLPSQQFVVVPITCNGTTAAFLIVGLNPYRRFFSLFQEFLEHVGEILAAQVERVRLAAEVERNDQLAKKAAYDFRRSELRFSRFAERSVAGLAMVDADGKLLYANEAWYKFCGLQRSEDAHIAWVDTVVAEDASLIDKWHKRVVREKQGGTFQIRSNQSFRRAHMYSANRTGICACYADLNEEGDVESVMILIVDISELKWVEQQLLDYANKLEKSHEKYRDYAEHSPLGIVRTDGEGNVLFGNDAWHAFYGFKRGERLGPQPWLDFIHEDDVQRCKDFFAQLRQAPKPVAVEFKHRNSTFTYTEQDRTFTNDCCVLATGFSAFNEDGTVDYIDFWVTDISAQKMANKILTSKMEEAIRLKTQQERFMDMISHEIRNPLSAVLHCGEEVFETMKKGREALDTIPRDALTSADRTPIQESVKHLLTSGLEAASTIMYCVQHQKQIVDDVLTLSKLDSDLLVVSPVPVQLMRLIRSSLKIFEVELKMTDISLAILEDESLAALKVGWVLIDPNRFRQIIINLVTNAIKFTKTSPVKRISITVSACTQRPSEQQCGVTYVPQRYTAATPYTSLVTQHMVMDSSDSLGPQPDIFLCFSIQDSGKGLSAGERATLFNRFAQASPKTHIEYGGSGLGLFISRQITEMLGGEIGIASNPGAGSTFAFYVKSKMADPPPLPSPTLSEPELQLGKTNSIDADEVVKTTKATQKPTPNTPVVPKICKLESPRSVLVIEDNLINQKVLCKQLVNRSFAVTAANHGKAALGAVMSKLRSGQEEDGGSTQFDVILCDIEMPVMDGIEFTREFRQLERQREAHVHTPILGVTANVRNAQVSAAIDAGMDGVTMKPYRIHELIDHINRVCPEQVKVA
ncbi:hypothetical protein GGR56DRAFT_517842 [Xylariaceae sp. FL0804]|nr:hypothetical protein GGR56DRAFT_517842 [Xylariaceae sp. FL0804]